MTHAQIAANARQPYANKIKAMCDAINDFRALLHSDKFAGYDSDGDRKDWIATGDVLNWLREIEFATNGE